MRVDQLKKLLLLLMSGSPLFLLKRLHYRVWHTRLSIFPLNRLVWGCYCMIAWLLQSGNQRSATCLHCFLLMSDVSIILNLPIRLCQSPSLRTRPPTRHSSEVPLQYLSCTFISHVHSLSSSFLTCRMSWFEILCICTFKVATWKRRECAVSDLSMFFFPPLTLLSIRRISLLSHVKSR